MYSRFHQYPHIFLLILICGFLLDPQPGYTQFDKLLKRTTDKLGNEVERMAVEKASDIIARQLAKKMEERFDEWLVEAAERDSSLHYEEGDSSAYRMGRTYGEFLRGMNDASDLPPSYQFDLQLLIETQNGKEKPEQMLMLLSRSTPVFGIHTSNEEGKSQTIVMDVERDVIVMYQEENGKKTAQSIPRFSTLASQSGQDMGDYHIEKTGKTERVAGYRCDGYEGYSDDYTFEVWVTDDLDTKWHEGMGTLIRKFGGTYSGSYEEINGVALKSLTWKKGKSKTKDAMRSEALEVIKEGREIVQAEYTFGYQNTNEDE